MDDGLTYIGIGIMILLICLGIGGCNYLINLGGI